MNTFYDYLYYFQIALQTPSPNAEFTKRLYSVNATSPQRAYSALEDPPALPQRPTARCLTSCANAKPRRLFWACSKQTQSHGVLIDCTASSQRLHSVFTALLATAQRASWGSATYLNAVETLGLVWQGFNYFNLDVTG